MLEHLLGYNQENGLMFNTPRWVRTLAGVQPEDYELMLEHSSLGYNLENGLMLEHSSLGYNLENGLMLEHSSLGYNLENGLMLEHLP